jgi:hypothetical protein
MLTVFAMPKAFPGHIGIIQRNAIGSWAQLKPRCEIILFGDEKGTAAVAREHGARHVPGVAKNEYGTPLLSDLFEKGARLASNNLLCYANSDIILMSDFMRAVDVVREHKASFLMVGECRNLEITKSLAFEQADWEACLTGIALDQGKSRGPLAIDYFVFPRGFYEQIPPFALGRAGFDNWLIWRARDLKAPIVDASRAVISIHQAHDYSHVPGGKEWSYRGEEAKRNRELAGGREHYHYQILDATYRLTHKGIKRNFKGYIRWHNIKDKAALLGQKLGWRMLDLTRPLRHLLGLRLSSLQRLRTLLTKQRNS